MDTACITTMMLAFEALNEKHLKLCARLDALENDKAKKDERNRMKKAKRENNATVEVEIDGHPYEDEWDFQKEERDKMELERIANEKRLARNLKSKLKAREKRAVAKADQSNATQSNATQSNATQSKK
jgi:hypothetical protein